MPAQHLSSHSRKPSGSAIPSLVEQSPRSEYLKRRFDLIVSAVIAVPALVVISVCWVIVRLTSAGEGFYTQERVGRKGRVYRIYKIRTMYQNCEATSGAAWSHRSDPRVTPIGRILRKLHLDELPQLLNVLKGDMSLVGPRPERPEFVGPLSQAVPGYTIRLAVRPGVTGLAQIQLPPDTTIDCVRKKIVLDQSYVREGSFWLDIRVLFGTAIYLFGFSYATVRKVMRLPDPLAKKDETGTGVFGALCRFEVDRSHGSDSPRSLAAGATAACSGKSQ